MDDDIKKNYIFRRDCFYDIYPSLKMAFLVATWLAIVILPMHESLCADPPIARKMHQKRCLYMTQDDDSQQKTIRIPYKLGLHPFDIPKKLSSRNTTMVNSNKTAATSFPVSHSADGTTMNNRASGTTGNETVILGTNITQTNKTPVSTYSPTSSTRKQPFPWTGSSTISPIIPLPSQKKPTDPLTLQDLQAILNASGYVTKADLEPIVSRNVLEGVGKPVTSGSTSTTKSPSGVAFPQPSILSYQSLKYGTILSSSMLGMILGLSILPNLWLAGSLMGGLYGYEITRKLMTEPSKGVLPNLLIRMGRHVAKTYLKVYDTINTLYFLYKTGQLSYEYWKSYAALDQKFDITSKIDSWNARFAQGKLMFDQWERENELGRKTLATLRTLWFVQERSSMKTRRRRRQSKYRLVQFCYDVVYWCQNFIQSLFKTVTGGGSAELKEFLQGSLQLNLSDSKLDAISLRIGASIAALVSVYLTGAVFAISPSFLGLLAITTGILWPTWPQEFTDRLRRFTEETRARGRGEQPPQNDPAPLVRRYDRSRYSYYIGLDGKKRFYRVGQPLFGPAATKQKKSDSLFPWQKPQEDKTKSKLTWPWS